MTILLAVIAPIVIGFGDHIGVGVSRKTGRPMVLVLWIYIASIPFTAAIAFFLGGTPTFADLAAGAGAGVFSALALMALYKGYSTSGVGVVASVAAVTGAVVPVTAATILDGLPSGFVQLGLGVGIFALWLIGFDRSSVSIDRQGLIFGSVAGLTFGAMSVMLGLTNETSGIFPLLAARATSVPLILAILGLRAVSPRPGAGWLKPLSIIGTAAAIGAVAFTIAAQRNLAVAGLFMQMAYGFTLLFRVLFANDRVTRQQVIGFGLAIVSLTMISLG